MDNVMTRQRAAQIIGISRKTLNEWIARDCLDIPPRCLLTSKHLAILSEKYGVSFDDNQPVKRPTNLVIKRLH